MDIKTIAADAREASEKLATTSLETRNAALASIARALDAERAAIVAANHEDIEAAEQAGLAVPLLKRLKFDSAKVDNCMGGLDSLIGLPDPVGIVQRHTWGPLYGCLKGHSLS